MLATVDILINGSLTADEDAGEIEVPIVAIVTDVLKPRDDDDATLVAEVEVELAAIEGAIPSAVVASATYFSVDTGVVDSRIGEPGVELEGEVNEETLTGNNVVKGIGTVVVVAVIEALNSVVDPCLTLDEGLDAISLAVVWAVDVILATVDKLIDGTLTVDVDVAKVEVPVVVVTEVLKDDDDDDATTLAVVELAAIEGGISSAVVTLATGISSDTGISLDTDVVDPMVGEPGVEGEVKEETLTGNNVVEGTGTVVVVAVIEALNPVIDVLLTLAVDEGLDAISLAVVWAVDVILATVDILIDGTLTVDEDVGETEVPVVVVVVVVTEALKSREDDEATTPVADVEVESAAIEGTIPSEVVTLATDISVDTDVVGPGIGGPGVEREVAETTPIGSNVVEGSGTVVVVAVVEELTPVGDA